MKRLNVTNTSYYLCLNEYGHLLDGSGGSLKESALGSDGCMWRLADRYLQCAVSDLTLELIDEPIPNQPCHFSGMGGEFFLQPGPSQLPSEHLVEMHNYGYTVLENVLDREQLVQLKEGAAEKRARDHAGEASTDGFFWMTDGLAWSRELCHAITHPVALWLIQHYLSTDDIHLCHMPVISTVKPAKELKGTFPEDGWHSDYPYHPGVFPDEDWPESPIFGVQYNICIDEFRAGNGATQFVPGSHFFCKRPPSEFNEGGTRMGEGVHQDVQQFHAPAGAALVYDSRTWHRRCDELNTSGRDRMAMLNAVTQSWVPPMWEKESIGHLYKGSDVPDMLTERQRRDIDRLCNRETQPRPEGMPILLERQRS